MTEAGVSEQPIPRRWWLRLGLLDNYGLVLLLLVGAFLQVGEADNLVWRVLLMVTLAGAVLATYRASSVKPATMSLASTFVVVALFAGLAAAVSENELVNEWVLVPMVLLVVAGPGVILNRIFSHHRVTASTILGAICVYVYIGLIFAGLFGMVEAFRDEPFFAQGPTEGPGVFLYFSFVTMTTLGYGDFSPAGGLGRNLAVLEALIGSIYLVTMLARLVGLYGSPLRTIDAEAAPPGRPEDG